VNYLLLATLTGIAFGQTSGLNDADHSIVLGSKLNQLTSPAAPSRQEDDKANGSAKGSPVLLQQVSRRAVQWTKTTAVCSLLKSDLTGSGQGRTTITLGRNPDGTFNYKTNDEVSGTASDKDNHHYIFFYVNNQFVDSGTGVPSPKLPFNVYGTDTFQLIPVDGGIAYSTAIYFKLRINADGSFTDLGSVFSPNAFCDPI
jgi:hypothetical protein